MLLLDRMIEHAGEGVVCEKTFREDDPFVEDGRISSLVALELFAQAAAAHFAYQGWLRGGVMSSGALLGTRRLDLEVPSIGVGERVLVRATQVLAIPPAAQFECTLERASDGTRIAAGSINVAFGTPPEGATHGA